MMGPYEVVLLAVALVTTIVLAFAIQRLADRILGTERLAQLGWLFVGALCVGLGISTVQILSALAFIGTADAALAVRPALLSLAIAVVAVAFALAVVRMRAAPGLRAVGAGVMVGPALVVAHFGAVRALGIPGSPSSDLWFVASVAAALLTGLAVLLVIELGAASPTGVRWLRAGSAVLVLLSVAGVAMVAREAAARPIASAGGLRLLLDEESVITVAGLVLTALVVLMLAATIDRRVRRRRAETEALRRSEDRFRSLVQASAQIVWTTSPEGEMRGEQASWSEFTGQEADSYQRWGWFNAIHPEDRERTARVWEDALANRTPVEMEHRVRRHDGRFRDCVARVVPVIEPDGRVREWVGTHSDVTDRARMQEERELLAEAGRVLSSSLDDRETLGALARLLVPRIADWCSVDARDESGALARIVATHQDPHRSSLLRELPPTIGSQAHGPARVLETGESDLIRTFSPALLAEVAGSPQNHRLLETIGAGSMICVPLTARGQVLGVLTLGLCGADEPYDLRDLALAEELARRSAIAIDNSRLYAGAQAAIDARDQVLGIVSHDLRNPLSAISTASELLLDPQITLAPEERSRHVEIIQRSAKRMNRLIRDLLDVSQTDRGQLALDRHAVRPDLVAREVCEIMNALAAEKSQALACDVAPSLPAVFADPSRVQQVLSNLIGNSIKFTREGGAIRLQVRESREAVVFSVMDQGPGIAPEDLPHLFDRHWRARSTAHLGAGLGLAISKGIVEAHGGRIWVESEPGEGTAVHFTIPRVREESGAARAEAAADESRVEERTTV